MGVGVLRRGWVFLRGEGGWVGVAAVAAVARPPKRRFWKPECAM